VATRVDIEEIQTTKSEKLLAVILAVFFLIGAIWTYQKIDDYVADAVGLEELAPLEANAAIEDLGAAQMRLEGARFQLMNARENLELRREAYRTALDAGKPTANLERAYVDAQRRYDGAREEVASAERAVREARPAATAAQRAQAEEFESRDDRRELFTFLFRLLLVTGLLGLGYWLMARLRARSSRYLLVAFAVLGCATVLAFVLAGDYITDYVDPLDLGPLVLSLFGIAATLAAFWALQRYLARRVPFRRVRKRECPFCGYPVGAHQHCEGCGREVLAACSTCGERRRVGTLHCGACGRA
jgi:hypothetical protein